MELFERLLHVLWAIVPPKTIGCRYTCVLAFFSTAVATPYVGGGLIAACSCWVAVTLYFFRRYTLSAWIALATVPILLVYKIAVIGR